MFAALVAAHTVYGATCWTLNTGEKFWGKLVSIDSETTIIETGYGELRFANSAIADIDDNCPMPSDTDSRKIGEKINQTEEEQAAKQTSILAAAPAAVTLDGKPAEPTKSLYDAIVGDGFQNGRYLVDADSWIPFYKDFERDYFPEGWLLKLRAGYSETVNSTDKKSLNLGYNLKKDWELFSLELTGYYEYAKDKYYSFNSTTLDYNETSVVSTDKYGFDGSLKYRVFGADEGWFLIYSPMYRVDVIKGIYPQIDNFVGVGYEFKNLKDYGGYADIAIGFTPRSTRVTTVYGNDGTKYEIDETFFMPSFQLRESVTWKLYKTLSFEHSLRFTSDMTGWFDNGDPYDFDNTAWLNYYTLFISVAFIYSPSDVLNLYVRYTYDFDRLGVSKGSDTETRLTFGIEIPIGWTPTAK